MEKTKLKNLVTSMLLLVGSTSLLSCSESKDDDKPAVPAAKEIEGIYKGDMTSSVMGSETLFEDMTFTVTATDDATATLIISSFGNPPMLIPEITVSDIKVSGEDGTYTLAPTEFSGSTASGRNYSGTAKGSYSNSTLNVQFNLQYGAMPMPLICSFSANKQ